MDKTEIGPAISAEARTLARAFDQLLELWKIPDWYKGRPANLVSPRVIQSALPGGSVVPPNPTSSFDPVSELTRLFDSLTEEPIDEYARHPSVEFLRSALSNPRRQAPFKKLLRDLLTRGGTTSPDGRLPRAVAISSLLLALSKLSWREVSGEFGGGIALRLLEDPEPAVRAAALRCIESWEYKGALVMVRDRIRCEEKPLIRQLAESIAEELESGTG